MTIWHFFQIRHSYYCSDPLCKVNKHMVCPILRSHMYIFLIVVPDIGDYSGRPSSRLLAWLPEVSPYLLQRARCSYGGTGCRWQGAGWCPQSGWWLTTGRADAVRLTLHLQTQNIHVMRGVKRAVAVSWKYANIHSSQSRFIFLFVFF